MFPLKDEALLWWGLAAPAMMERKLRDKGGHLCICPFESLAGGNVRHLTHLHEPIQLFRESVCGPHTSKPGYKL